MSETQNQVKVVKTIESNQKEDTAGIDAKTQINPDVNGSSQKKKGNLVFEQYTNEKQLDIIKPLMDEDLSEPYSVFTYRYFVNNWPQFTFLARMQSDGDGKENQVSSSNDNTTDDVNINSENKDEAIVGAIVCKCENHSSNNQYRGYIAMLAVDKKFRKKGIGSEIVSYAIQKMKEAGCTEIVLETEVANKAALKLYENLGFVRDKRLHKYYLNGGDAFRLKLWFS